MQPIPITRTKEDLHQQFKVLKKVELFTYKKQYYPTLIALTLFSLIFLILFFFTNSSSLVTLKAVSFTLLGLAWFAALIFAFWKYLKWQKNKTRINENIETEIRKKINYFMSYDTNGITHSSDDYKTELKWNHFVGYLNNRDSVFLFPKGSIYSCISFSKFEIGKEHLDNLLELVKVNIPILNKNIKLT